MNRRVPAAIAALRDAPWLTRERALAYCQVFFVAGIVIVAGRILLAGSSRFGVWGLPLKADFISFWTASKLALAGHPAAVYDIATHWAVQRSLFADSGYFAFFYPPVFLLICLPLALLPFHASLAAFLAATGYACWRVVRTILPDTLPFLAYPGVIMNLAFGQNGFLTTALFGGAIITLERQPILSGILFGCLSYKPHLAVAVPVALVATRRWLPLGTAAATSLILIAYSIAAFGTPTWMGFFGSMPWSRMALEHGLASNLAWESTFRAVRSLHGSVTLAYLIQGLVSVAALGALAAVEANRPGHATAGVLPMAALLATPFLLDYDLMLMVIPIAWVVAEARRTGFLGWEKLLLSFGFLLPAASPLAAHSPGIPLAPAVMIALFGLVVRRALVRVR